MQIPDRRDTYNGFGETLARAFEMVVTPGIFGGLGYLLDRGVGTAPVFMLVFFLVAFSYIAWRMWREYDQRMRTMEEKMGFRRRGGVR